MKKLGFVQKSDYNPIAKTSVKKWQVMKINRVNPQASPNNYIKPDSSKDIPF
jgi:hypothetical protein